MVRVLAGRYELVRFVGRGGMGEVWEGRDRLIERRVAVKLLPRTRHDDDAAELFFREARTAGALSHPGVVTVYDLGRDDTDGSLFLVMEFVGGRDLATVLRDDGPPSVTTAVDWAAQAAAALAAAHDAGVFHRDLKPANMMLTEDGRITVLDFGIARFAETARSLSAIMGTPAYMPPERFDGHRGDARSDLYSLGCVLTELLTGTVPFDAPSQYSVMDAHRRTPPTPPSQRRPGVPPALDRLVLDLLAKNPDHRPTTAHNAHRRLLGGDSTLTGPGQPRTTTGPTHQPRKARRPRWLPLSAVGGLTALLIVLLVIFVPDEHNGSEAASTPSASPEPFPTDVARPVSTGQLPALRPQSVVVEQVNDQLQVSWKPPQEPSGVTGYFVILQTPDGTVHERRLIARDAELSIVFDQPASCAVVTTVVTSPQGTQLARGDLICPTTPPARQD